MCEFPLNSVLDEFSDSVAYESNKRLVGDFIRNIFKATGVSIRDFNNAVGSSRAKPYRVNEKLKTILKSILKSYNIPTEKQIQHIMDEKIAPDCIVFIEIINELIKTNFTEDKYASCRNRIEDKIWEIERYFREESEKNAKYSEMVRERMTMFMTIRHEFEDLIYQMNLYFENHKTHDENTEKLSEFSVLVLKLVKLSSLISKELSQLKAYSKYINL